MERCADDSTTEGNLSTDIIIKISEDNFHFTLYVLNKNEIILKYAEEENRDDLQ